MKSVLFIYFLFLLSLNVNGQNKKDNQIIEDRAVKQSDTAMRQKSIIEPLQLCRLHHLPVIFIISDHIEFKLTRSLKKMIKKAVKPKNLDEESK